jgi:hypothetical protein
MLNKVSCKFAAQWQARCIDINEPRDEMTLHANLCRTIFRNVKVGSNGDMSLHFE